MNLEDDNELQKSWIPENQRDLYDEINKVSNSNDNWKSIEFNNQINGESFQYNVQKYSESYSIGTTMQSFNQSNEQDLQIEQEEQFTTQNYQNILINEDSTNEIQFNSTMGVNANMNDDLLSTDQVNHKSHFINIDQDESQFNYSFNPNMIPSCRIKSSICYSNGGILPSDLSILSCSNTIRKTIFEEKPPKRIHEKSGKKEFEKINLPGIDEMFNSYLVYSDHFNLDKIISISGHEQEIVRNNQCSRFWITKQNIPGNELIKFSHNVISIHWEFNGTNCPYFIRNDLFRGLIGYYSRQPPKGMENVFKAKLNLYRNYRSYFEKLTTLKAFKLDDSEHIESQPFNVFLTILKVMKGFGRDLDIKFSIISKKVKYNPLNTDIHIIKVEGTNIAIGEQNVHGIIYPFFMTIEEIIHEGKCCTYVFSNLILPHENIKQIKEKEKYLELRKVPWWINHPHETSNIFQSNLKNWKDQEYDILETDCDELIYNVPNTKEEIQTLYQTTKVNVTSIRESDDGFLTDFIFKITFPYSYYTKENINGNEIYMENFPNNDLNTPFIKRDEFFELLKIISTYCDIETIPNDIIVENKIRELTKLPSPNPIIISENSNIELYDLPQIIPDQSLYHTIMNIPMCEEDDIVDKPYFSSFNHDDNPPPEFC